MPQDYEKPNFRGQRGTSESTSRYWRVLREHYEAHAWAQQYLAGLKPGKEEDYESPPD